MARQRTGGRLVACRADSARPPPALGWAGQPSGRCAPRHATPVASAARQLAPGAARRGRLPAVRAGRAPGKGSTGHRPGAGLGPRLGRAPVAVGGGRRRARRTGCGAVVWWVATECDGVGGAAPVCGRESRDASSCPRVFTVSVTVGPSRRPPGRPGRTHTDANATTSTLETLQACETSRENWHAMTSSLRCITSLPPGKW